MISVLVMSDSEVHVRGKDLGRIMLSEVYERGSE